MKNYLAYKEQIRGFTEVSEAVKTEEKIAASLIAGLRTEMVNIDAYQGHIKNMLDRLALFEENFEGKKPQAKIGGTDGTKSALVILTSDKGLTGGLWRRMVDEFLKAGGQTGQTYQSVITVGTKGEKYLREEKRPVEKSFETAAEALGYVSGTFQKKTFSRVDILYPKFISLLEHRPVIVPFLPFAFDRMQTQPATKASQPQDFGLPIIDPAHSGKAIFAALLRKYGESYFQKIAVEGRLSEQAARTISMEHANTKTEELIKSLGLKYRKERRRALTQKQLESFIAHKII